MVLDNLDWFFKRMRHNHPAIGFQHDFRVRVGLKIKQQLYNWDLFFIDSTSRKLSLSPACEMLPAYDSLGGFPLLVDGCSPLTRRCWSTPSSTCSSPMTLPSSPPHTPPPTLPAAQHPMLCWTSSRACWRQAEWWFDLPLGCVCCGTLQGRRSF